MFCGEALNYLIKKNLICTKDIIDKVGGVDNSRLEGRSKLGQNISE